MATSYIRTCLEGSEIEEGEKSVSRCRCAPNLSRGSRSASADVVVAHLISLDRIHIRRLRAIRHSVSSHVFTSIVHAFVCSHIDYCNSLLVGLPKVRLSPIQSVLNAAA